MILGDEGNDLGLCRLESAQIPVLDQVIRMLVMARITDVRPDVVQQSGEFQPFPLAIGEPMHVSGLIEDRHRQPRNLVRVLGPVAAPLCQLDDAAAPDVGIAIGLRNMLAIALDVIEHQTFAQREIAERDLVRAQAAEHGVEQHGAGHHQIGAPRIEAGQLHPRGYAARGHLFAQTPNLLRGDAKISHLVAGASPPGRCDRAETENGARGANHAIEPGRRNVLQVRPQLVIDVFDELPFVAL